MRLVNTFLIVMYGVMNYLLLRTNLVAFYAKLNKISKIEFHFVLEVSFSICCHFFSYVKPMDQISQNLEQKWQKKPINHQKRA